jgi:Ca-activated chloride channel homolog
MTIRYPEMLWFLLATIPVGIVLILSFVRGRRDIETFHADREKHAGVNLYLFKAFFSGAFFVLFYVFAVLAISGISWGRKPVEEDRNGLNIAFAVDVSLSMKAQDISPDRLSRAGQIIRGVCQDFPLSRFSVTVFTGDAVKIIPLTNDTTVIESFLGILSPELMTSPGTDMEKGVRAALESLPSNDNRYSVVILFSDGEYHSGVAQKAAREARDRGIPIFTILTGGSQSASIPHPDGDVVRDGSGDIVLTAADPTVMERLASDTEGRFLEASDPQVFASVTDALRDFEGTRNQDGFRLVTVVRYRVFLSMAVLSLLLHLGFRMVRWKRMF